MTSREPLPLKIAIADYGHTAALKQGKVPIAGVHPDFVEVKPIIAAFRRMVRDVEFDVCEMAPATYMIAREHGAQVTQREFDNWAAHQNWALKNVPFRHPWVFYIDADERVTPKLRDAMLVGV